jgi:hypothetical protein
LSFNRRRQCQSFTRSRQGGRAEIQGKVMGKFLLFVMALTIAVLIGLSVWVIAL